MSGQIQSYSKPTRFDLVVEKSDGQCILQKTVAQGLQREMAGARRR